MSNLSETFQLGGDLEVRRLGFGAMRIRGTGIWGAPADPAEAKRVLRRTVELGVNFIDTADSYGPDVSERLIGETLVPFTKGLVVATEAGLVSTGPDEWQPLGAEVSAPGGGDEPASPQNGEARSVATAPR